MARNEGDGPSPGRVIAVALGGIVAAVMTVGVAYVVFILWTFTVGFRLDGLTARGYDRPLLWLLPFAISVGAIALIVRATPSPRLRVGAVVLQLALLLVAGGIARAGTPTPPPFLGSRAELVSPLRVAWVLLVIDLLVAGLVALAALHEIPALRAWFGLVVVLGAAILVVPMALIGPDQPVPDAVAGPMPRGFTIQSDRQEAAAWDEPDRFPARRTIRFEGGAAVRQRVIAHYRDLGWDFGAPGDDLCATSGIWTLEIVGSAARFTRYGSPPGGCWADYGL